MAGNENLNAANREGVDEFYTQLTDIEKELRHYRKHFAGKTVFCNCDDPFESNFFKYFVLNFNRLKLKKLIATCFAGSPIAGSQLDLSDFIDMKGWSEEKPKAVPYKAIVTTVYDKDGDGGIDMFDVAELFRSGENELTELKGDGDFRSEECIELLKQSDIVVTNPPFSLFRDYIALLTKYEKKFIVIGNKNSITYAEFFPLLKNNKVWIGYGSPNEFDTPNGMTKKVQGLCRWFTNLEIKKHHEDLILVKHYNPEDYPKFVNYDAINVGVTNDIPCDYPGLMGVPITFFDKFNPDQFEIYGISLELAKPMKDIAKKGTYMQGGNRFYSQRLTDKDREKGYLYHREYDRIVIRNKHPEQPKEKK